MSEKIENLILDVLKKRNLPAVKPVLREIPFEGQVGVALSNVFQIAREAYPEASKKELSAHSIDLADIIAHDLEKSGRFERVESMKGYVNCFFNISVFSRDVVGRILAGGTDWAKEEPSGGRVMVEYSQPNTHKAFHIGHVRNVVTGATLVRCFRYAGRETLASNYYGDIGSHVFKSLWFLEKYAGELPKDADKAAWLGECYAAASELLDESQQLKFEVWDTLKPLSVSLGNFWADGKLTDSLGIDSLVRKIALREEDLFENRSTDEISGLIEKIYKANLDLFRHVADTAAIDPASEAVGFIADLNGIIARPGFDEIWNRQREVIEVAERWGRNDKALRELWEKTRQWSMDGFHKIYGDLGAEFDVEFSESEVEEEGLEIVRKLTKDGIATESAGAMIVEIDKKLHDLCGEPMADKYRVLVLVRADGASLYGAKDLALAKRKFEDYEIEESIYVVGNEQKFYFQQLFQILRLMGFPQWEKCFHLSYELVMLPSGKISSRKGRVVLYEDVIRELRERALNVVRDKNPGLDETAKNRVSEIVAMGALIFGMLRVDTNKKIEFDFDEVLDFDGRSAPYIQYACTRAGSILRKAEAEGVEIPDGVGGSDLQHELLTVEIDLLKMLSKFPDIIVQVVVDKKPIHLASFAYDLAVAFSNFYHQCPVLAAAPEIRRGRLLVVKAVRITLESALGLLGITAPEVM